MTLIQVFPRPFDYYNSARFGVAHGDTGTGESTRLNTMIVEATANGTKEGNAYLRAGTIRTQFTVIDPFTNNDAVCVEMLSGLRLYGDPAGSILKLHTDDCSPLHAGNRSNIIVRNVQLTTPILSASNGVKMSGCSRIELIDVHNTGGYIGFAAIGCQDIKHIRCTSINGTSDTFPSGNRGFSANDFEYTDGAAVVHTLDGTRGIYYERCVASGIAGYGFRAADDISPYTGEVDGIEYVDCIAHDNTLYGFLIERCRARARGTRSYANFAGYRVHDCEGFLGEAILGYENERQGFFGTGMRYGTITGGSFRDNGQEVTNTYDGVQLTQGDSPVPSIGNTLIGIQSGNSGGTGQRYGIDSATNATNTTIIGGDQSGNVTGARNVHASDQVLVP